MRNYNGLYSCRYDSTKQRSLILANSENYKKYTISMRLEMLLAGTIVITDAQWYDGLYFSRMIQNGEFDDFIGFISKEINVGQPPLQIRRRNSVFDMFKKPFWFSSIENEELQSFLYGLYSTDIFDKYNDKNINESLDFDKYFNLLEDETNKRKENIKDSFEMFRNRFSLLHKQTPEKLFVKWGEHSYIPEYMLMARNELYDLLNKNNVENNYSKIDRIKKLIEDKSSRSEVLSNINELIKMPKINDVNFAEYFMSVFDSYYNLAIAKQHSCKFFDVYDYHNIKCKDDVQLEIDKENFPQVLFKYLGNLNWKKFGEIYYNQDIKDKRDELLKAFESKNHHSIKMNRSEYINLIMQKIYEIEPSIINDYIFYNSSGTKRFINIDASKTMCDSKNFCFYYNLDNVIENMETNQHVRYANNDEEIEIFDTIIVPIECIEYEGD